VSDEKLQAIRERAESSRREAEYGVVAYGYAQDVAYDDVMALLAHVEALTAERDALLWRVKCNWCDRIDYALSPDGKEIVCQNCGATREIKGAK
jgi:hypothetical protein